MFNDVANTAASQLIGHPPKSNLEPREITNDRLDRQDRRVEDILTLSPKAVKALEQNIATFNLKNESYAEARAEVLSTRELTDKEFFSLDVKLQEPIITSINKKFSEIIAEKQKERIEAEVRFQVLSSRGLSEEDFTSLEAEVQQRIQDIIEEKVREKMKAEITEKLLLT